MRSFDARRIVDSPSVICDMILTNGWTLGGIFVGV